MLSKKQVDALIKKRKAIWRATTKPQRRILVARDVIAQIKADRLLPMKGRWIDLYRDWSSAAYYDTMDSMQEVVLAKKAKCQVCALGSIMASMVLFKNMVTIGNIDRDFDYYRLRKFKRRKDNVGIRALFSRDQLELIEGAFEMGSGLHGTLKQHVKGWEEAKAFGVKFNDSTSRLIAIMKNIIKNKGEFVP